MAQAAGVQQQPEHGELIEQLALHQQLQIRLQVGRLHQRGAGVQQPQAITAEQQAPVGAVIGIEAFLQTAVGGAAPPLLAEGGAAPVELVGGDSSQDQGHRGLAGALAGCGVSLRLREGPVADRVEGVAVLPAIAGLQVGPTEHLPQQSLGEMQAGGALGRPLAKILVLLPDLLQPNPGRIDPLAQPLPLRQAVVGFFLHRRLQARHLLQQRRRQQAALELDRLNADGGGGAGHGWRRDAGRVLDAGWRSSKFGWR